jgi:hypothetical protein
MVEHVFMSRWGCGPFDNDTAADFVGDLDDAPESERIGMIYDALAAVGSRDSYVDGFRTQVALAAAALVARNLPGGEELQSRYYGPDNRIPPIPENLVPLAAEVVDCLLDGENDVKVGAPGAGVATVQGTRNGVTPRRAAAADLGAETDTRTRSRRGALKRSGTGHGHRSELHAKAPDLGNKQQDASRLRWLECEFDNLVCC